MAGTYWLTVLPDTSKLKPAIDAAMRGQKIKADFGIDQTKAQKAGREAREAAEKEINKSKPKLTPQADKAGADKAGQEAGRRVRDGFKKTADGHKVGREFGDGMAGGLQATIGKLGPLLGGLSIAGGLGSSIKEGMAFTESLNVMQGVTSASGEQIKQVSDLARQLGTDVNLAGINANDAATAMTELAKGGMDVEKSMAAVRGTLALASAANIDAASAAMIQSDALNMFQIQASDSTKVADLLVNAANASSSDVPQMAQALAQAGSAASGFGVSIEDTLTSLAMFSNFGIKGSDAGTLMKSSLIAITDGGKPATEAMNALGLELYKAGEFVGYPEMLRQVAEASTRMSEEQFQGAAAVLFGSDALRGAMVAANGGSKVFNETADAVVNGAGAINMASTRMQGLPGAWGNFTNMLDNVKMNISDMVAGPLEKLLKALTGLPDFVSRNSDAFKIIAGVITTIAIPALIKWIATQTIAIGASVVGGISSLIGVWGSMGAAILNAAAAAGTYAIAIARGVAASILSGLTAMVGAFRNLAIGTRLAAAAQAAFNLVLMANPIGLIIAAVVAVGVALWAFFTKTETGRKLWDKIWTAIKNIAGTVFDFLKTALQVVGDKISWLWNNIAVPAFMGIKGAIENFWAGAKVIWDVFTTALQNVGNKVVAFKDVLVKAFNAVKDVVTAVWDKIGGIIDKIGSGIGKVADFMKGAGGAVLNAVGLGGGAAGGMVVSRYAAGGKINGPGTGKSDSILGFPAMVRVSNGEYIVNAASTQKYLPLLQALNAGALPGFASGGLTPHANEMKSVISRMFGVSNIGGYREPDGYNEHSTGNALDVMIPNSDTDQGKALGNSIAAWALKNAKAIGLTGMIWRQTSYGYGSGFDANGKPMPDRGNPTANHMDHVHIFMNEKPDTSIKLSGAPSMNSSPGASTSASGGSYRSATSAELSASSNRVSSAGKAVDQAQQRVDDRTFDRDQAQKRLDAARAAGKDTTEAERSLYERERELGDATEALTEKRTKLAEVTDADAELRTQGKFVEGSSSSSSGSDSTSGSGGNEGADFGQMFMSGLLESVGLDGTLFSNPMEWPSVKSIMAGVNYVGGLLSVAGVDPNATTTDASTVSGVSDVADATGVGSMLSTIPDALSPGGLNPATVSSSTTTAAPGAIPIAQRANQPTVPIDNSININGNVGMDPIALQNKMRTEGNARTRTTKVNG